jgi:hypothetical protein
VLVLLCIISEMVEQQDRRISRESVTASTTPSPVTVNHSDGYMSPGARGGSRSSLAQPLLSTNSNGGRGSWGNVDVQPTPMWRKFLKAFCLSETVSSLLER